MNLIEWTGFYYVLSCDMLYVTFVACLVRCGQSLAKNSNSSYFGIPLKFKKNWTEKLFKPQVYKPDKI